MERAISRWLQDHYRGCHLDEHATKRLRLSYVVYGCMLLLPPNAFGTIEWQEVHERVSSNDLNSLYESIAAHLKVTHIAINQPIPLANDDASSENVLRAPSNFTPVYGDFGPSSCNSPPTAQDLGAAFWVTAKQNGIYQTWAPRWTMFSRGNISEKARLLTLPSVLEVAKQPEGCTAVDLYAGIGYFAFSYLKTGVGQVLCWDMNEWSIAGLKRGAAANAWSWTDFSEDIVGPEQIKINGSRLLIFNEPNEHATSRINQLRSSLAPIRHVNCGLLPTSRGSWHIAVNILDAALGGWIHIHENFATQEIEEKAEAARVVFQRMCCPDRMYGIVRVEQIHRVKSYAPGVMHCVLDMYIPPRVQR